MKGKKAGWRKKAPEQFQQLITEAQDLRLYLINENGPTSFIYCDDDKRKFKITIGETICCSCGTDKRGHCVHTLHAMIKKFRVDPSNPIIWQEGYGDSEISDLIAGKYSMRKPPPQMPSSEQVQQAQQHRSQRQELTEESLCPICQEVMRESEAVTYCKKTCGNNFHIQCLKVWVEQKQFTNVTCPMCRQGMGQSIWSDLMKEQQEFVNKVETHRALCAGCQIKPIVGTIYQCVYCKSQTLCSKCYLKTFHPQHNEYLFRSRVDQEWKPIDRASRNTKVANIQQVESLNELLIQCFPYDDQVQSRTANLFIIGSVCGPPKKKCDICNQQPMLNRQNGASSLRRLKCGHLVDNECLRMLQEGHFICPLDGVVQLEGYLKTTGIKPVAAISKQLEPLKQPLCSSAKPPSNKKPTFQEAISVSGETTQASSSFSLRHGDSKLSKGRLRSLQQREPEPPLSLQINGNSRFNERGPPRQSFKIRKGSSKLAALKTQHVPDMLNVLSVQPLGVTTQERHVNEDSDDEPFKRYNQ